MLQGANSTGKAVAKTKLANIKSKNARASLANITMLFPPDTTWRRGWSYVQQPLQYITHAVLLWTFASTYLALRTSMFFWDNLPPTILKKNMENCIKVVGACIF